MATRFKNLGTKMGAASVAVLLAACGTSNSGEDSASGSGDDAAPVKVGIINSYSGAQSLFAKPFETGFKAAIDHYTDGTNTVDGHKIEIVTGDDTGQPATGTSLAKDMIAEGAQIITGPTLSSVALPVAQTAVENQVLFLAGAAGTTALAGMSPYVFAMAGYSPAGSPLFKAMLGADTQGKIMADIEQDYAYGQAVSAGNKALVEPLGIQYKPFLLPQATTDFTSVALQIKALKPAFIAEQWSAGPGKAALLQTLTAQGLLDTTKYVATLSTTNNWPDYGAALGDKLKDVELGMMYLDEAGENDEAKALREYSETAGSPVDSAGHLVGWMDGAAVVHALKSGGAGDVQKMIKALEGYSFEGPAGKVTIRNEDHLLIQPGFTIRLAKNGSEFVGTVVKKYTADELTPPVVKAVPR